VRCGVCCPHIIDRFRLEDDVYISYLHLMRSAAFGPYPLP
jgi:hypothetical protein